MVRKPLGCIIPLKGLTPPLPLLFPRNHGKVLRKQYILYKPPLCVCLSQSNQTWYSAPCLPSLMQASRRVLHLFHFTIRLRYVVMFNPCIKPYIFLTKSLWVVFLWCGSAWWWYKIKLSYQLFMICMYVSSLAFQYILLYQFKVCLMVEGDNSWCTMWLVKIAFC